MTKQSQALFLAQKMGLRAARICQDHGVLNDHVTVGSLVAGDYCAFIPHHNKAQWAEVLLWWWKQAPLYADQYCVAAGEIEGQMVAPNDNTDAGIMAATLEAICRAMGW